MFSGHSFLVLWQNHIMSGTRMYHHGTMFPIHSWPLYDLEPKYWNYIFHQDIASGQDSLCSWHRHTKFGREVCHHVTTCCVYIWPLYDLDLYVGGGGILSEFYSVFILLHVILKANQPSLRTMPQIHTCTTFIIKENVSAAKTNAEFLWVNLTWRWLNSTQIRTLHSFLH